MKIVLLGLPGSGKDTQGELLTEKFKIPLIATGDILRHAIAVNNSVGKKVNAYIKKGKLVPDKLIDQIVKARLKHKDCQHGFILDGFPRDVFQAQELQTMKNLDYVFYITSPKREIIKRISNRRVCGKCGEIYNRITNPPKKPGTCDKCKAELVRRDDDKVATIRNRLKIYEKQTKPLIAFYSKKGIIKKINGNQSIEKVFKDIKKILK